MKNNTYKFTFGKYKGYTLSEIKEQDSNYINWLLSDKFNDKNIKSIVKEFVESYDAEPIEEIINISLLEQKEIGFKLLETALENEDYLNAAKLRDELIEIEKQIKQQRKNILSINN